MRRGGHGDEKLAAVSAGAGVSHRQQAGAAESQGRVKLIRKPIARPAAAGAVGIAALNHKVGNDPVKDDAVIEPLPGQKDKVVDGAGGLGGEQFHRHIAVIGADGSRVFLGRLQNQVGRVRVLLGGHSSSWGQFRETLPASVTQNRKWERGQAVNCIYLTIPLIVFPGRPYRHSRVSGNPEMPDG